MFHFTDKDYIPVITFPLDGTGLDHSSDRPMQLHFDRADLRKTNTMFICEGEASLRVGETIVAMTPLKPRIAWRLAVLASAEKGIEGFLDAPENILQHLGMDLLVLLADRLDLWQLVRLLIVVHGHFAAEALAR